MSHIRKAHSRWLNGKRIYVSATIVRRDESTAIETRKGRAYPTKCPMCGDVVYYFHAKNGGKAWFSLLGHSWPKHACFTRGHGLSGGDNGEGPDLVEMMEKVDEDGDI